MQVAKKVPHRITRIPRNCRQLRAKIALVRRHHQYRNYLILLIFYSISLRGLTCHWHTICFTLLRLLIPNEYRK